MWWEFKLIFSAIVILAAAWLWQDWANDQSPVGRDRRLRIYNRIALVCLAITVLCILSMLWTRGWAAAKEFTEFLGFIEKP